MIIEGQYAPLDFYVWPRVLDVSQALGLLKAKIPYSFRRKL